MFGLDLTGKIAVVTGSGRGIGKQIAVMLAEHGANVVLTARTDAEIQKVRQEICDAGGSAVAKVADVTSEAAVAALFAYVASEFGMLDILVNNAGVGLFGPLAEMRAEDFDATVAVNMRGTFLCSQQALRMMIRACGGYIINIASIVGLRGYPDQAAYSAAKHGVMGLTKSLAAETQKYGIRVSAILPGGVDTDMVRRSRPDLDVSELLHPSDVAQAVEYLLSLSDRASVDEIYIRRRNSKPF
ncbi:MAG: SDR family oxidoreductase [Lentisphaerae bacterium]|nr:SDR family oxidoreductase [Lentisphaerota bacterium]